MPFDPDAAAQPGSGLFGLPHTREEARIVVVPAPFDATTSYGNGAADGPAAVLAASAQVDLYDRRFGRVYEQGIFMQDEDPTVRELSREIRALAEGIIERGGAGAGDAAAIGRIDAAGERMNRFTHEQASAILREGKIPALLGGDHSTPFGAIRACAEHHGSIGLLHVDAHMDFRDAFEGFRWSHASIMFNVLTRVPRVGAMVQFGIRDFGEGEMEFGIEQGSRVLSCFDDDWAERMSGGASFAELAGEALERLPELVYISFDIDALDPSLCPHTGTPVPGGLSFHQAGTLLRLLWESGRRVVGFDLVEVCPGRTPDEPEWDANVGARILYKLCGAAQGRG